MLKTSKHFSNFIKCEVKILRLLNIMYWYKLRNVSLQAWFNIKWCKLILWKLLLLIFILRSRRNELMHINYFSLPFFTMLFFIYLCWYTQKAFYSFCVLKSKILLLSIFLMNILNYKYKNTKKTFCNLKLTYFIAK